MALLLLFFFFSLWWQKVQPKIYLHLTRLLRAAQAAAATTEAEAEADGLTD
jgi:hypothetical protein